MDANRDQPTMAYLPPAPGHRDREMEKLRRHLETELTTRQARLEAQFEREIRERCKSFEEFRKNALEDWLRDASMKLPEIEMCQLDKHMRDRFCRFIYKLQYNGCWPEPGFLLSFAERLPATPLSMPTTNQPVAAPQESTAPRPQVPKEQPKQRSHKKRPRTERPAQQRREAPEPKKRKMAKVAAEVVPRQQNERTTTNLKIRLSPNWVFTREVDGHPVYGILTCPKCNFAFSEDPFEDGRATNHFRQCGVPFDDENTIFQQHAVIVVAQQRDAFVTRSWVDSHNKKVRDKVNKSRASNRVLRNDPDVAECPAQVPEKA